MAGPNRLDDGVENLRFSLLTEKIIGLFYDVYNELGYGFLESVYEQALLIALRQAGLDVEAQVEIPVRFRGLEVGNYKADLQVDRKVLIELKAARSLEKAHGAQILNYLKATNIEVGLLLNFGEPAAISSFCF
jgi:GxxExxY protein